VTEGYERNGEEEGKKERKTKRERETAGNQIGKTEILVHLFPVSPPWSRNIPYSRCEGSAPASSCSSYRKPY
jgi:hypothetical protein